MANSMDFCPNSANASDSDGRRCPINLVINYNSLVDLDISDVKLVADASEKLLMNTGIADSVIEAAENAIHSTLLGDTFITECKNILIIISGAEDLTMYDISDATESIYRAIGKYSDTNIIFGTATDLGLKSEKKVTVLASGIKDEIWKKMMEKSKIPFSAATPKREISYDRQPNVSNE